MHQNRFNQILTNFGMADTHATRLWRSLYSLAKFDGY